MLSYSGIPFLSFFLQTFPLILDGYCCPQSKTRTLVSYLSSLVGPENWTKSRPFVIRFVLAL